MASDVCFRVDTAPDSRYVHTQRFTRGVINVLSMGDASAAWPKRNGWIAKTLKRTIQLNRIFECAEVGKSLWTRKRQLRSNEGGNDCRFVCQLIALSSDVSQSARSDRGQGLPRSAVCILRGNDDTRNAWHINKDRYDTTSTVLLVELGEKRAHLWQYPLGFNTCCNYNEHQSCKCQKHTWIHLSVVPEKRMDSRALVIFRNILKKNYLFNFCSYSCCFKWQRK